MDYATERRRGAHKSASHYMFLPEPPVSIGAYAAGAGNGAPAEAAFCDADGHRYLHVDIVPTAGTATGTIRVWVWNEAAGAAVPISSAQEFDTNGGPASYAFEIAGRAFYVEVATAAAAGGDVTYYRILV